MTLLRMLLQFFMSKNSFQIHQMTTKLSESYPMRRAAQIVAHVYFRAEGWSILQGIIMMGIVKITRMIENLNIGKSVPFSPTPPNHLLLWSEMRSFVSQIWSSIFLLSPAPLLPSLPIPAHPCPLCPPFPKRRGTVTKENFKIGAS
jgi:hypothetical protein